MSRDKRKYRLDVPFLCCCDGSMCSQPHHPDEDKGWCLAEEILDLYTVRLKEQHRWMLCAGCHRDIRANGISVIKAYPGSRWGG